MTTLHTNNTLAFLQNAINAGSANILVQAGQGAQFPAITPEGDDDFFLTIEDRRLGLMEIVLCTARTVDSMTVVRGQQGTVAKAFSAGASVSNRITAGFLNDLDDRVDNAVDLSGAASGAAAIAVITANDAASAAGAAALEAAAATAAIGPTTTTANAALVRANEAYALAEVAKEIAENNTGAPDDWITMEALTAAAAAGTLVLDDVYRITATTLQGIVIHDGIGSEPDIVRISGAGVDSSYLLVDEIESIPVADFDTEDITVPLFITIYT